MRKTLDQIKDEVHLAFSQAKRDYRKEFPRGFLFSRGRFLSVVVADEHSNTHEPLEGESWRWDGRLADIHRAIDAAAKITGHRPVEVHIFGGLDYADSLREYQDGEYNPLVVEWEVKFPISDIPLERP